MKIELKKISVNERMSQETTMFIADLYINGKKVGYCRNEGCGGCTYYNGDSKENNELIAEAEAYCKTLPKEIMFGKEFEQSLESVIDSLLEEFLLAKEKKKFEKNMVSAILYGIPKAGSYNMIKYKQPLSELVKSHKPFLIKKILEIKTNECKGGVVILNTNLEALGLTV